MTEHEARLQILFDTMVEGVVLIAPDGQIMEANPAAERILGLGRSQITGRNYIAPDWKILRPDGTPMPAEETAGPRAMKERRPIKDVVMGVERPDGSVAWLRVNASPLLNAGGGVDGVVGTFADITEPRQAEQAIRESEGRYRALVESIPQKIFLKDSNSIYISCNRSYAQDLGIRPEDIPGRTDYEFYSGDLAEKYIADDRRVMESGKTERFEERYTLHGQERVVETFKTPVRDDNGKPVALLGVFEDVTERKQAEEALSKAKDEYQSITNLTGDIIVRVDKEGRWTFLNDTACAFWGETREDLLGRFFSDYLHPDDQKKTSASVLRAARLGDTENVVNRQRTPQGWRIVQWNGAPLYQGGEYIGVQATGRDITERKQAEEALRQSKELYDQLAEQSRTIAWEVDAAGLYTYISPMVEEITGYRPEEIVGKMHFYDLHPEEGRQAFKAAALEVFKRKDSFVNLDNILVAKDGHVVWVTTNGGPLMNADGTLRGYRGSDTDITARKRADEALRESEARYRFIADNTSDSIWALGPDLRMTYQSPSTERLFGYTLEEWHKIGWDEYVHPDHLDTVMDLLNSFRNGERESNATISVRVRDKYGKDLWAEMSASPVRGPNGEFAGVVGVTRDITGRKEAEDRLVEYKTAVEQSADGIAMSDLAGNIRFVNEAWARMHGYSVGELIGRHLSIFHTQEQMESQVVPFQRRFWQAGSEEGESWHVRRNGEVFPTWMTMTLLRRADGEPFGMFALIRDITDQKETERQQRDQDIAEARAEELTISRRRVIDAQESLRKDIAGRLHGTVQNRLILLGHKLAELESRPAAERTAEELADIRLTLEALQSDHIRAISHRLFPSVLRLGISAGLDSLVDQYRTELPIQLRISKRLRDREQANRGLVPDRVKLALYRVAEEALGNIVKHTPAAKNVAVNLSLSANRVLRLTVDDDGGGPDRAAPSTGIGLALISDYTAAAGGSCTVKNVPGKGTRVTAQVPLAAIDAERRQRGWLSG